MKQVFKPEFKAHVEINGHLIDYWTGLGLYKDWQSAYDHLSTARELGYETRLRSDWVPSGRIIQYEEDKEKE